MTLCRLAPAQDLSPLAEADGRWLSVGVDPAFHLVTTGRRPFRAGWLRISCRLVRDDGREPVPVLYSGDRNGLSEGSRQTLRWTDGEIDDVVYLPSGTTVARFDPFEEEGAFTLSSFSVTRVPDSKVEPADRSRRLGPLASADLEIDPGPQIEPLRDVPSGWRSLGDDPNFHVTPKRGRLRSGWVRISSDIKGLDGLKIYPSVYFDAGAGFTEALRQWLQSDATGIDDIVRLPRGIRALRLDPLDASGTFVMSRLTIERVGLLRAGFRIVRKFWDTLEPQERAPAALLAEARRLLANYSLPELGRMLLRRAQRPPLQGSFKAWIDSVEAPARESEAEIGSAVAAFATRPVFSIVMPVYNTPKEWLDAAIASVRAQLYPDWELCICDDASPARHVRDMLSRAAAGDPRIKVVTRQDNGHISKASNDAIAIATGTHMVLMDHDDLIPPHALFEFARALNEDPSIDFIYSDEDKIMESGVRYRPFFKPDWSPEYLEGCMYTSHLACYDMRIVRLVGGFRSECNGAQDYDFVLRYTEHVRNVRHIPKILYHWRSIPGSTAADMSNKDYVIEAAVRGLEERARRTGELDIARAGPSAGSFVLRRKIEGRPLVSIVIPSAGRDATIRGRSVDLLANCVATIFDKSTYDKVEIIVVDNDDLRDSTRAVLERFGVRSVSFTEPDFNVAAKMNLGARHAGGEFIVFLNDDTEVITPDWLESMLATCQMPGVGMVGAKLLFETGELQNVGVTFAEGLPDEIRRGYPGSDDGYAYSSITKKNYMAVTGACVMIRKDIFDEVGGFDERFRINYNDIDLCLKVWSLGRRIVFDAQAQLFHFESRNRARTVDPAERDLFRARWAETVRRDPFYPEWFQTRPPTFELDPMRF